MIYVEKDAANDERLALAAAEAKERDVRRTFRNAVGDTVDATDRAELARAVLLQSETLTEAAIPWDIFDHKLSEISFTMQASVTAGISLAVESLQRRRRSLTLRDLPDVTQRAVEHIDAVGAATVTEISASSKLAVKTILRNGIVTGAHVSELTDNLVSAIGLNQIQAGVLARYQAGLIESGVSDARRILLVGKRAKKMLRQRGETIARTEVMTAINAGKVETWQAMIADGTLSQTEAVKVWVTAKDERVCTICGPLDNTEAAIGQPFAGIGIMYPAAHPNCRCTTYLRLKRETQ